MSEFDSSSPVVVSIDDTIIESVSRILVLARQTLLEQGVHLPTAILHTINGLYPIVLPFEDDDQKRILIGSAKKKAIEKHSYAVTTVTAAHIVHARSGLEEEALVLATSIQGGMPYIVLQGFSRDENGIVTGFGELIVGDEAAMPGQMMVVPDWEDEVCH